MSSRYAVYDEQFPTDNEGLYGLLSYFIESVRVVLLNVNFKLSFYLFRQRLLYGLFLSDMA